MSKRLYPKKRFSRNAPLSEKLLRYSVLDPVTGCLIWQMAKKPNSGHGITRHDGKNILTHRAAWLVAHGELPPPNLRVLHRCNNAPCINIDHLYLGTPKQNSQDMMVAGHGPVGERNPNTKLTEAQVRAIRADHRDNATLAPIYGITINAMWAIRTRRTWRHLDANN